MAQTREQALAALVAERYTPGRLPPPVCDRAWPVGAGTHDDTYRQHRCGRSDAHHDCVCRYCGAHRSPTRRSEAT